MKKKNNKKVQSNSAADMLIDFSEGTEEGTEEVTEASIAEEVRASLAKDVQSTLVEQENAKGTDTPEKPAESAQTDSEAEVEEEEDDESGPTFIEIPNEGNSDIVVGTFLYTPSEEVGKALKKDRKEKRKRRKLQEKQQKKAQKERTLQERPQRESLQREAHQKETAQKKSAVFYVIPVMLLVLIAGAAIGLYVYERGLVYSVVHVEAGISVDVADLLVKEDENAYFTEDSEAYDMSVPGEYHLKIHTGGFNHKCTLFVEDTTAPVVKAKEILDVEYGSACEPEDFMESIEDATATTVSFVNQPDYNNMEEQNIELTVTDLGNNVVTVQSVLRVSRVVTYLELEAGSVAPTARDFMISATDAVGTILTDLEEIDFGKVGEYPIQIEVEGVTYNSVIAVVDTIPPVFETKDIEGYALVKREAADFVVEAEEYELEQIVNGDAGSRLGDTEVTYTFETEPDLTKIGTQTLTIIGTDEGGNTCTRTANLTLKEDTEDPTITGGDFTVYLGDSISYKSKVSIKDNCMDDLDVKVDTSKVNTAAEGTYPVTYTVTDAAGHSATLTVNMTIKEHTYDVNELNEMADGIIASIITADMSQYDKAWAVFSYIRGHVAYISESEKGDWVKAAYEGLNTGKGDCYVYASVSKLLLTRAGITNMDIERIPSGNSMHYWNLVDIGDGHGWYHFDTTPRKDHPTIFLWDDATLKEYSDNHNNCHNYDRTKYPVIN